MSQIAERHCSVRGNLPLTLWVTFAARRTYHYFRVWSRSKTCKTQRCNSQHTPRVTQKQSHKRCAVLNDCQATLVTFSLSTPSTASAAARLTSLSPKLSLSPLKLDDRSRETTTWAQHNLRAIHSHQRLSEPFFRMWRAWLCPQLHQDHRSYRSVSDLPTINIHTIYPEQWAPSRTPRSLPFFFPTGH